MHRTRRLRQGARYGMLRMMTVPELDIALRTRGRAKARLSATKVREIVPADLALLASGREVKAPTIVRLRDRHHAIARLVASGRRTGEISALTGMCISRISILKGDPTFQELVAHYRSIDEDVAAEITDRMSLLALTAVNNLQELAESDEDPLTASQNLELAKLALDRIGHAPVTKVQQTNINVDLGGRLAAARSRLEQARIVANLDDGS